MKSPKPEQIRRQVDVDETLDLHLRLMAAKDRCPVAEFIRRLIAAEWERRETNQSALKSKI